VCGFPENLRVIQCLYGPIFRKGYPVTEQDAVQIVDRNRENLQIDSELRFESAEKVIFEYKNNPEEPA